MKLGNTLYFVAAVGLVTVSSCAETEEAAEPAADVVVADSAGVQLVQNLQPSIDTSGIRLIERVRIGAAEGDPDLQFHIVRGVAVDSAGLIYVIDEGSQSVRVFDQEGSLLRRFGGRGQGPGEFTGINGLFLWRDTVHVVDYRNFKGAFFNREGELLGTYRTLLSNRSRLQFVAGGTEAWIAADDSLFASRGSQRAGAESTSQTLLRRVRPDQLAEIRESREAVDSLTQIVTQYQGGRSFGMLGSEGGSERFVLMNPPLFEPRPSHAIDGGQRIYVSRGWPYLIDVYDNSGQLVRRISRAHDSIQVGAALVDEVLRRAKAHYDTSSQRRGVSYHTYSERAKMPRIGFVPVIGAVKVSSEGWTWVRRVDLVPNPVDLEWSAGANPVVPIWDIFDTEGRYRKSIRVPRTFNPHVVLPAAVVGTERDELDVPHVVWYDIQGVLK